jgi:hypothetical protein
VPPDLAAPALLLSLALLVLDVKSVPGSELLLLLPFGGTARDDDAVFAPVLLELLVAPEAEGQADKDPPCPCPRRWCCVAEVVAGPNHSRRASSPSSESNRIKAVKKSMAGVLLRSLSPNSHPTRHK